MCRRTVRGVDSGGREGACAGCCMYTSTACMRRQSMGGAERDGNVCVDERSARLGIA